jgi:hypothetical protein
VADEPNTPNPEPGNDAPAPAAVVERPSVIPETMWDGEKNAPKWDDLGAAVTERDALKNQQAERAAQIPATPDAYKFELPKDFELPGGYKWEADPKDPLVAGVKEYAAKNKLTQGEVSDLVKLYAGHQAEQIKSLDTFKAEQTKTLGEKAPERRAAVNTFIDSMFGKDDPKGAILKTMTDYAPGVEALEAIIAKAGGINPRGTAGATDQSNPNAKNVELVGQPGGGRRLLDAANAES